jgi:hypothetical protein
MVCPSRTNDSRVESDSEAVFTIAIEAITDSTKDLFPGANAGNFKLQDCQYSKGWRSY